MRPSISIHGGLLGSMVLVIVLLGGSLLGAAFYAAGRTSERMSEQLIENALVVTEQRLRAFFDPISRNVMVVRSWGTEGSLDLQDEEHLNSLLTPIMRQQAQASSLMVADSRGHEYMLTRMQSGWRVRLSRPEKWGSRRQFIKWTDKKSPKETWMEKVDYDPRTRPWYEGASKVRRLLDSSENGRGSDFRAIHWTPPYQFFTGGNPGLTASAGFVANGREHVVGFDVLLDEISQFTTSLQVGQRGMILVTAEDGRVIGLPNAPQYKTPRGRREALLKNAADLRIPAIVDALRAAQQRDEAVDAPIRYTSGGKPWWGAAHLIEVAPKLSVYVAVVVPESDLVGGFSQQRFRIMFITGLVLLVAILLALVTSRRFSSPIEELVAQSDRISKGDLSPPEPIKTSVTELRQLADAHARMHTGLTSLIKIERDLQLARRIQQATIPTDLPKITGFDIAAWNEPADETGGDTFDVIGYCLNESGEVQIANEAADFVVLLLADATGHGIGPALTVTQLRSMVRVGIRTRQLFSKFAQQINRQLCEDLPDGRFITAWIGQLNGRRGTLKSFAAGQAPLFHYHAAEDRFDVLGSDTIPFGLHKDMNVEAGSPIELRSGDIFVVVSDGILEAKSRSEEYFGQDRVQELIRQHAKESSEAILRALRDAVEEFSRGTGGAADDQTVIVIKRTES